MDANRLETEEEEKEKKDGRRGGGRAEWEIKPSGSRCNFLFLFDFIFCVIRYFFVVLAPFSKQYLGFFYFIRLH
jgi:hypothetical protein